METNNDNSPNKNCRLELNKLTDSLIAQAENVIQNHLPKQIIHISNQFAQIKKQEHQLPLRDDNSIALDLSHSNKQFLTPQKYNRGRIRKRATQLSKSATRATRSKRSRLALKSSIDSCDESTDSDIVKLLNDNLNISSTDIYNQTIDMIEQLKREIDDFMDNLNCIDVFLTLKLSQYNCSLNHRQIKHYQVSSHYRLSFYNFYG